MNDVVMKNFLQREDARHAVDQSKHDNTEANLQLRVLEQLVNDNLRKGVLLQIDDDVDAMAVSTVVNVADLGKFLVTNKLTKLLEELLAVDLIRNLLDDDLAAAVLLLFDLILRTDRDGTATGLVRVFDTADPHNLGTRGEVGTRQNLHELFGSGIGIINEQAGSVDHFAKVMRRDVRSHTNCNASRTVNQQVRETGRQNRRFFQAFVVVGLEVDRFLVKVAEQLHSRLVQTSFGITHCSSRVTVDRAEVAVAVNQRHAHAERLSKTNHGVVNGGITMRVILTNNVTDGTG